MLQKIKWICILSSWCLLLGCEMENPQQEAIAKEAKASSVALGQEAVRDSVPPKKSYNFIVESSRPKNQIEQQFPYDISVKTVDEKKLTSTDILNPEGKPVVLLFWLTTCYPCRLEMAAIAKEYEKWQEEADFKLIAISTDFPKNFPNFVKRVNESNWPWDTYYDVRREFRYVLPGGLNGLPQTFVFNPKGEIVYHKRKYSPGDEKALFEQIKAAAM